jgi:hypothetical protein
LMKNSIADAADLLPLSSHWWFLGFNSLIQPSHLIWFVLHQMHHTSNHFLVFAEDRRFRSTRRTNRSFSRFPGTLGIRNCIRLLMGTFRMDQSRRKMRSPDASRWSQMALIVNQSLSSYRRIFPRLRRLNSVNLIYLIVRELSQVNHCALRTKTHFLICVMTEDSKTFLNFLDLFDSN